MRKGNLRFGAGPARGACAVLLAFGFLLTVVPDGAAQINTPPSRVEKVMVDSGVLRNTGDTPATVWAEAVVLSDATWVRLSFQTALLGEDPQTGTSSTLMITSALDGATQYLNAETMRQWHNTSAYFNGDTVLLELIAYPNGRANRITLESATAGEAGFGLVTSICGPTDDRLPSDDPRGGRALPIGCSAWMIDDGCGCLLTAGHCASALDVIEFNVPLSNSDGSLNHPPPEDQYTVDPASLQTNGGQGVGDDWSYFGCFANSTTGLTPFEAQGATYILAATPPPVQGQDIRITGYGTMSNPPEWNQVQKTHVGPYVTFSGTLVQYQTDTTGGNSGSPVINENTGEAIGIHTHGGCTSSGGENSGTGSNHSGLQNALANPIGVCEAGLRFQYPVGRPTIVAPGGGTQLTVSITEIGGSILDPTTVEMYYDLGSGFVVSGMDDLGGGLFVAAFPPVPCGDVVAYYVRAELTDGTPFTDPRQAPSSTYGAVSAYGMTVLLADDFEQDLGWTVVNENLDAGAWERGDPVGGGDRGDPADDYDGSGKCYLTENVDGDSDVDGGPTRLISPRLDFAATDGFISYARWFTNDDGDDTMVVEISNDDGTNWNPVETVGDGAVWIVREFLVSEYTTPSAQIRLRFSVADQPNDSVTEAGLDAFNATAIDCAPPYEKGDLNCDGLIDGFDIDPFVLVLSTEEPFDDYYAQYPNCDHRLADINADGRIDGFDIDAFVALLSG
ncbi:MAG: trypsin-like peptidase domain-containing protein [Planctomycetes bacterium]|nr:trypsin-like peptidase domain-containing protein [Planctomycetota bacterium]